MKSFTERLNDAVEADSNYFNGEDAMSNYEIKKRSFEAGARWALNCPEVEQMRDATVRLLNNYLMSVREAEAGNLRSVNLERTDIIALNDAVAAFDKAKGE